MRVTHVIRGDDHLANTPRQILLYQALGYGLPAFGHVPLILGPDKARLSKRHGAMSVTAYRDLGLPARRRRQLPRAPRLVARRSGGLHPRRADQLPSTSRRSASRPASSISRRCAGSTGIIRRRCRRTRWPAPRRPYLEAAGLAIPGDDAWLARALVTLQERAQTLVELVESGRYYFTDDIALDPGRRGQIPDPRRRRPAARASAIAAPCSSLGPSRA